MTEARWLEWARRIAALAQNGLAYTDGVFDRQRYEELRGIAAEMMAAYSDSDQELMDGDNDSGITDFGPGDRAGLRRLGSGPCFRG